MPTRSMLGLVVLGVATSACSITARSPDQYRDDTQALLQTRREQIGSCYDVALKTYPTSAGRVTVRFTVEEDTGKITSLAIDDAASSAPPALRECVLRALGGLALAPPDARPGDATFVWEFSPSPAPTPAT